MTGNGFAIYCIHEPLHFALQSRGEFAGAIASAPFARNVERRAELHDHAASAAHGGEFLAEYVFLEFIDRFGQSFNRRRGLQIIARITRQL